MYSLINAVTSTSSTISAIAPRLHDTVGVCPDGLSSCSRSTFGSVEPPLTLALSTAIATTSRTPPDARNSSRSTSTILLRVRPPSCSTAAMITSSSAPHAGTTPHPNSIPMTITTIIPITQQRQSTEFSSRSVRGTTSGSTLEDAEEESRQRYLPESARTLGQPETAQRNAGLQRLGEPPRLSEISTGGGWWNQNNNTTTTTLTQPDQVGTSVVPAALVGHVRDENARWVS